MTFKSKLPKYKWRERLTIKEKEVVKRYDELKDKLEKLVPQVSFIRNRAIHRCKYEQEKNG